VRYRRRDERESAVAVRHGIARRMAITQAKTTLSTGSNRSIRIYATITNATGADDRLLGASSPVAASGGLYAWPGAQPPPVHSRAGPVPDAVVADPGRRDNEVSMATSFRRG